MATFDDVARIALELPETEETTSYGNVAWAVRTGGTSKGKPKTKGFVWERPLSKKDRKQLSEDDEIEVPPDEVILAAMVDDLAEKEAVLAEHGLSSTEGFAFTTPHFTGYPAVLVRLDEMTEPQLREVVTSAWLAVAPQRLVDAFDPPSRDG